MWVLDRMPGLASIHKSDGTPCSSTNEVLARWSEHYEAALNHPAAASCPALNTTASSAVDDPNTPVDAPTLVQKLRNGRAAGCDWIPPELLKCALEPISSALHSLFLGIWQSGKVLAEWKEGIIVSLYKGYGGKSDCRSYRPITLLSVPGKMFAHVVLAGIKK
jgi:hypothetical protein